MYLSTTEGETMKTSRLKPLRVAIDKIVILGDLKDQAHTEKFTEWIQEVGFEKAERTSSNYGYKDVYHHKEYGYIEFSDKVNSTKTDHQRITDEIQRCERQMQMIAEHGAMDFLPSMTELLERRASFTESLEQCDERGFLKRLKDVRYEYNPKYSEYGEEADQVQQIQKEVVLNLFHKKISNLHIAMDYAIEMSELYILDKKARSETINVGKDKQIKTKYIGVRASKENFCFYDKKQECRDKGTIDQYPDEEHVTRFELRIRGHKVDDIIQNGYDPFKDIRVIAYRGQNLERLDGEDRLLAKGMLLEMKQGKDPFSGMTKYKRNKYRELFDSLFKVKIDLGDDFKTERSRLAKETDDLMNC